MDGHPSSNPSACGTFSPTVRTLPNPSWFARNPMAERRFADWSPTGWTPGWSGIILETFGGWAKSGESGVNGFRVYIEGGGEGRGHLVAVNEELHNHWATLWHQTFGPASESERDRLFSALTHTPIRNRTGPATRWTTAPIASLCWMNVKTKPKTWTRWPSPSGSTTRCTISGPPKTRSAAPPGRSRRLPGRALLWSSWNGSGRRFWTPATTPRQIPPTVG